MSHPLVTVPRGRRNVARLRLRRPIRENPNISLPFAALVTKPGEKTGLCLSEIGGRSSSRQMPPDGASLGTRWCTFAGQKLALVLR